MNLADANYVLAAAAAYDNRTPSNEQAIAWSYALGQHKITREEALRGVIAHFSQPVDGEAHYLEPGHVIWQVKLERRRGLDHSARLEQQMLRDVDPDDPGAVIHTLTRARQIAAQGGESVPARMAITGKFEDDPDRDARTSRGIARIRAILADLDAKKAAANGQATDDGLTPAVRAARERAKTDRRTRRTDPAPIGDVLGQIRRDR